MKSVSLFARLTLLVALSLTLLGMKPVAAQVIATTSITCYNVTGSTTTWACDADVVAGVYGTTPSGTGLTYSIRYTTYVSVKYHYHTDTFYNYMMYGPSYNQDIKGYTQIGSEVVDGYYSSGSTYATTSPYLDGAFDADDTTFFRATHTDTYHGGTGTVYTLDGIEYSYEVKCELIHLSFGAWIVDGSSVVYESTWGHTLGNLSH